MSIERKEISDSALDQIAGGVMKFSEERHQMAYKHPDGTITVHNVNGDVVEAYKRASILHSEYINNEDKIFSILHSEGLVD